MDIFNILTSIHHFLLLAIAYLCVLIVILLVILAGLLLIIRKHFHGRRSEHKERTVAFFHPYCNAGGGGERVLWCALEAIQSKYTDTKIFVYTGDVDVSPQQILRKAEQHFNVRLENVEFIYLHKRHWVEAKRYPYFTLLGQAIGSMVLGYEALEALVPDIYIDTEGYAFTLPIFKYFGGSTTASYVHYPTITAEMVNVVSSRDQTYNNRRFIARSPFFTAAKLIYYRLFALLHRFVSSFSNLVMVNSSWTEEHVNALWRLPSITYKVYPPCDTKDLESIPLKREMGEKIKIVSVSQFRKEKNHPMQLRIMDRLRDILKDTWEKVELVVIGSTRCKEDEEWLQDLKDLARHYSIENNVIFKTNVTYEQMKEELAKGTIGIHTMWNEHFGIGIVELMAAGLIMIAHKSGGPKMDLIEENITGFLADDETEYAQAIVKTLLKSIDERYKIQVAARSSSSRFSQQEFQYNFLRVMEPLFRM